MKKSWKIILDKLGAFVLLDKIDRETNFENIFPEKKLVFHCFDFFEISETKIVIIGQDPYHKRGIAMGLAFSANNIVKTPASLRNIFIELSNDLGIKKSSNDLTSWAEQKILLLNTTLTVKSAEPNSHLKKGWQEITDGIIKNVDETCKDVIFLFLGSNAAKKSKLITNSTNLFFTSHPSPLSSYRGFFGSKVFSRMNETLIYNGKSKILW